MGGSCFSHHLILHFRVRLLRGSRHFGAGCTLSWRRPTRTHDVRPRCSGFRLQPQLANGINEAELIGTDYIQLLYSLFNTLHQSLDVRPMRIDAYTMYTKLI